MVSDTRKTEKHKIYKQLSTIIKIIAPVYFNERYIYKINRLA